MNCFKMLLMLIPVLLIRCSAPEDQTPPEPSASTEAVQKKEEMKPDVRNVRWGMTAEEIRANEKLPLEQIGTDFPYMIVLKTDRTEILGHPDSMLFYKLFKDLDEFYRLREVGYGWSSPNRETLFNVMATLAKKYGSMTDVNKKESSWIWITDDERTFIELKAIAKDVLFLRYSDYQHMSQMDKRKREQYLDDL